MLVNELLDGFDRHTLGLGDTEDDKEGHEDDETSEHDEDAPGHGAEHGEEGLADQEREPETGGAGGKGKDRQNVG